MKNLLLLFGLLLSTTFLVAQSAVGFHFSLGQSHSLAPFRSDIVEDYYSIASGFDYQHQLSERIFIYAGFGLLTISEQTNIQNGLRWGSEHNGLGGYQRDPTLPHSLDMRQLVLFFSVQAGMKYYITKSKIRLFAQPYLEENIFLAKQSSSILFLDDGSTYSKKTISEPFQSSKPLAFAMGLGFGAEIDLGRRFSLYLMPEVKLLFTDISTVDNSKSLIPAARLGVWYKL